MRQAYRPLLVVSLLSSFSCSVWLPPAAPPPRPAPMQWTAEEPAGPTAVDFVEARFRSYHASLSTTEIRQVSQAVIDESLANDLPWDLVLAVIQTESGFHNFAVSNVGALGLMQIMPATGEGLARREKIRWQGPETLFQPLVNVKLGTRYLRWLHDRYDNWDQALAAYNWGPGHIDSRLRRGRAMPVEYAHTVMSRVQSPVAP